MQPTFSLNNLTVEQVETICAALELYGRVGLGQLEKVADAVQEIHTVSSPSSVWDFGNALLGAKQLVLGIDRNGSLSISSPSTPIAAKRSFDLISAVLSRMPPDPTPLSRILSRLAIPFGGVATINWSREPMPHFREESPLSRPTAGYVDRP